MSEKTDSIGHEKYADDLFSQGRYAESLRAYGDALCFHMDVSPYGYICLADYDRLGRKIRSALAKMSVNVLRGSHV